MRHLTFALAVAALAPSCSKCSKSLTHKSAPAAAKPKKARHHARLAASSLVPKSHGLAKVPVTDEDPSVGPNDAPVTLVIFGDLECPFTARFVPTARSVRVATGAKNVRIVFKHNPLAFHSHARTAAEAAAGVNEVAGGEAFFEFADKAFSHRTMLSTSSYKLWADDVGASSSKISRGLSAGTWGSKVDDDIDLARRLGVRGTPLTFVNGRRLSGAVPDTTLQVAVDDELSKAKAAIAGGTSKDDVYREMTDANFAPGGLGLVPPVPTHGPSLGTGPRTVVPIGSSPARGGSTPLVTIVEYGDYQCPFTKRAEATLATLRSHYGADLRIVWKDNPLPFHPHAKPAAQLARAVRAKKGLGAFWATHDDIFRSQPAIAPTDLERIGVRHGLTLSDATKAVGPGSPASHAIATEAAHASTIGAAGTPTFFIDGRRLTGAQPYSAFSKVIDEEIKLARLEIAKGTPRTKLYDVLSRKPPPLPSTFTPPPLPTKLPPSPPRPVPTPSPTPRPTPPEPIDPFGPPAPPGE